MRNFLDKDNARFETVHVTAAEKEEKESMENLTKDQIEKMIYEEMSKMDSRELREQYYRKTVCRKSKKEYISFYYELVGEAVPVVSVDSDASLPEVETA